MANVETRRDENTFLGSWCNIRSYEHIFYERRLGYKSILSRSGHAVAHDEERSAFERLGKRAGHTAQVAKFGDAPRATARTALASRAFVRGVQGRVGNVASSSSGAV